MSTMFPLFIFSVLVIAAAFYDLTSMTIPNWISGVLIVCFIGFAVIAGMPLGTLGLHVGVGVGVLLLGMVFFALGWMGGGDVKFFAALSLWFGWQDLGSFLLISTVFGGLLTAGIIFFRQIPLPGLVSGYAWLQRLHHKDTGVPYGIAIAAGTLFLVGRVEIFSTLAMSAG